MDVWFDSGVSHTSVMEGDDFPSLTWPADLYLEGADQYRGWFQSSLLTSVVYKGSSPYKAVCTHGWVVDGEGKTMHKSLGNGIDPKDITDKYGADILRLWVASSDYHSDIRISKDILAQLSDSYKKIRNTARFILGNLTEFDINKDAVSDDELFEIDKLALVKLDELIDKVNAAYDVFDYHIVFHAIHNFCVIDMSNYYLDVIKDRLYCEKAGSVERRAAQTTIYRILSAIARLVAPILSFTADEIWQFMPHAEGDDPESIFLNDMPAKSGIKVDEAFTEKWKLISAVREDAKKALELKRSDKVIGASLEASVTIYSDAMLEAVKAVNSELKDALIVSEVKVEAGADKGEFKGDMEGVSFTVAKAEGEKCERCWSYDKTVGQNAAHPTLCARCCRAVE